MGGGGTKLNTLIPLEQGDENQMFYQRLPQGDKVDTIYHYRWYQKQWQH